MEYIRIGAIFFENSHSVSIIEAPLIALFVGIFPAASHIDTNGLNLNL